MPHYYVTADMAPEDPMTDDQMRSLPSGRVWVVDMAMGRLGPRWVPVPPHWKEKNHFIFSDVATIGDLIIVEFETGSGHDERQPRSK